MGMFDRSHAVLLMQAGTAEAKVATPRHECVRGGVGRIAFKRLLQERKRGGGVAGRVRVYVRQGAQQEIIGVEVFGTLSLGAFDLGLADAGLDRSDHADGNVILERENVFEGMQQPQKAGETPAPQKTKKADETPAPQKTKKAGETPAPRS